MKINEQCCREEYACHQPCDADGKEAGLAMPVLKEARDFTYGEGEIPASPPSLFRNLLALALALD